MQLAFRGRPSKGCNLCRKRKVKCDESHPRCERCAKGGLDCVYRDEFDLLLRNQTSETAVKAQKKWRSRAKKAEEPASSTISPSSSGSGGSLRGSPETGELDRENKSTLTVQVPPPVSLDQSIYDLARQRFVFDFVVPDVPQMPRSGFAAFVPRMMREMTPGSCVFHALQAASLANFAGRSKSIEAADLASKECGKAIARLGPYVADPGSSPPMETLAATCLLGVYEIQASPFLTHGGSWQAHVNGSCAILNSVYASDRDKIDIGTLFLHIVVQMLISKMSFGFRPTIPMSTVNTFIKPKTMAAQVILHMYKTTEIVAEWRTAQVSYASGESNIIAAAKKMIEQCNIVDAEMGQWLADRPPIWEPSIKPNIKENIPSWLRQLYSETGAPYSLTVYNTFWVAHRWTLLRSTRMQLHQHTLNAVDVLIASASTDEELTFWLATQNRLERHLLNLINETLSAVIAHFTLPLRGKPQPKCVQDVPSLRGYTLLWPVYRAAMCFAQRDTLSVLDTEGSKGWARSVICFIRDEMGFRKCEAFVDNLDGKFGKAFS